MFSGLVFCNDCKQKLYYSTTNYFEKRQDFFICSTHRANKDKCSGKRKQKIHISYNLIGFIPVDVLTKAEQA